MTRKKNQKRREAAKTKKATSRSNSDASMEMANSPTESSATEHTVATSTTPTHSSADEATFSTGKLDPVASSDSGSQADEESEVEEADDSDDMNQEVEADQRVAEIEVKIADETLVQSSADDLREPPVKQGEEGPAKNEVAQVEAPDSSEDAVEAQNEPAADKLQDGDAVVPQSSETSAAESITAAVDSVSVDGMPISNDPQKKEEEQEMVNSVFTASTILAATEEQEGEFFAISDSHVSPMALKAEGLPSDHKVCAAQDTPGEATEAPIQEESLKAAINDHSQPVKREDKKVNDTDITVGQAQPDASESIKANYTNEGRVISNESISNQPSVDVASETVATVALQCLERDKDMELSYVAILSAITVLKQKRDDIMPLSDEQHHRISGLYSRLIQVCTQDSVRDGLAEETLRQGVLSQENLYFQLYQSILDAGFHLEDKDHMAISRVFLHYKRADKALQALELISSDHWKGAEYRHAILCCLASKPRQQAYIDALLAEYQSKEGESMVTHIQEWYHLCQQDVKWEDTKSQYERRRARLVDAPSNIERLSNVGSIPSTSIDLGSSPSTSPHIGRHERTSSTGSTSTTASSPGHQRTTSSSSHQRTPSVAAASWPSGAPPTLNAPVASTATASKGPFSFLSNFKFPGTGSKTTPPQEQQPATLPSSIHVNHHLTVLDNNMLEECVKFKEFEYGWKRIYEQMGAQLEDKDTAKIVMRLCKRAFLGFGGAGPEAPGSPNVQAKDIFDQEGDVASRIAEAIQQVAPSDRSQFAQDPEIWEARAWAVYNKAMMNPQALGSSVALTHHHHNLHHAGAQGYGTSATAVVSMDPSQPIATLNNHTAMSVFLHDILTIATCSPEKSSRYFKAYRVYSMIRSDPATQPQLRDPFVMRVMIKAIYDSVLFIMRAQEQRVELEPSSKEEAASSDPTAAAQSRRRRSSTQSMGRVQAMSIGPLMDLAFEIYSDLRDIGSIRQLSWMSSPSGPGVTPTTSAVRTSQGHLALFFSPSASPPAADTEPTTTTSPATAAAVDLSNTPAITTTSASPRTSLSAAPMPIFQELSPLLTPSPHARILPNDIYLALLHLCIQIPVWEISSKAVQTIVADMKLGMEKEGERKFIVDRDIAAALQCYHDTWMCASSSTSEEDKEKKCSFQAWMYREEAEESGVDGSTSAMDAPTCNENGYWNLWSSQDSRLTQLVYSKNRAIKLIEHVEQALSAPSSSS